MIRKAFALTMLPAALFLGACDDDSDPINVMEDEDIIGVAESAGSFTTLLTALDAAGLTDALRGDGPFTVFAPTDEAFGNVDPEVLSDLVADIELLTAVLTYHVVPGSFLAQDVVGLDSAPTLNGKPVSITGIRYNGGQRMINKNLPTGFPDKLHFEVSSDLQTWEVVPGSLIDVEADDGSEILEYYWNGADF